MKLFLSHSSNDKWYVGKIADKLKTKNCEYEYDAQTFDEGSETLKEIYDRLGDSGIFVIFLSFAALDSVWVQKEVLEAEKFIMNGKLHRFLPIIIESGLTYENKKIPGWMSDSYNLQYVPKINMAYGMIQRAIFSAYMEMYPEKRKSDRQFAGRNKEIQEFESTYRDPEKEKPVCCMVNGLVSIGRRTFLKYVLNKVNVLRNGWGVVEIPLNQACSIDALIERVCLTTGLELTKDVHQSLSTISMTEKVLLATKYIEELSTQKQTLMIIDSRCIVDQSGNVVDWFLQVIEKLSHTSRKVKMCVVSQYKPNWKIIHRTEAILCTNLQELDPIDRYALLEQLLEEEEIDLEIEDKKIIGQNLTGYPEQVKYAITVLKEEGFEYLRNNLNELSAYVESIISRVISKCNRTNNLVSQVLALLSLGDGLALNVIMDVFKGHESDVKEAIQQLTNSFVIEYVGNGREFLRLNDAVRDYVQRKDDYSLDKEFDEAFHTHIKKAIQDTDLAEQDPYDLLLSVKEALKREEDVPNYLLIPSHYLLAIKDLYKSGRPYSTYRLIVELANRALVNEQFLDERFIGNVRYYKCLALSRMKDREALKEINKVDGIGHHYLLGFFYRMTARYQDAIDSYKKALDMDDKYFWAKRDLVYCYLNMEDYEAAYEPAHDLYEKYHFNHSNPIFIQSYIRCIMHVKGYKERELLNGLLDELNRMADPKAHEMYLTSRALFCANLDRDVPHALQYADDAIAEFPDVMYPYLTKLEILSKTSALKDIADFLKVVEKKFDAKDDIFEKFAYLSCKCLSFAMAMQKSTAEKYFDQHLRNSRFPKKLVKNLEKRMKEFWGK